MKKKTECDFECVEVPREELRVGECVLSQDGRIYYTILSRKLTWIHSHLLGYYCLYANGNETFISVNELAEKKKVLRVK